MTSHFYLYLFYDFFLYPCTYRWSWHLIFFGHFYFFFRELPVPVCLYAGLLLYYINPLPVTLYIYFFFIYRSFLKMDVISSSNLFFCELSHLISCLERSFSILCLHKYSLIFSQMFVWKNSMKNTEGFLAEADKTSLRP